MKHDTTLIMSIPFIEREMRSVAKDLVEGRLTSLEAERLLQQMGQALGAAYTRRALAIGTSKIKSAGATLVGRVARAASGDSGVLSPELRGVNER